jgi:hypothetical protein
MSAPQAANNASGYGYDDEPQPAKGKTEPGVKGVVRFHSILPTLAREYDLNTTY